MLPPLEFERIVTKALQKDRNLRYQTAAGVRADLLAYKVASERGKSLALHGASLPLMQEPLALKKGPGGLLVENRSPGPR